MLPRLNCIKTCFMATIYRTKEQVPVSQCISKKYWHWKSEWIQNSYDRLGQLEIICWDVASGDLAKLNKPIKE